MTSSPTVCVNIVVSGSEFNKLALKTDPLLYKIIYNKGNQ